MQQLTGLSDEFCDFEGLYQVRDAVFLQEGALVAETVREGEQDMIFHGRAIVLKPLVGLLRVPLARELAVHDESIERFGEQASLHILTVLGGDDCGTRAGKHVALKFEDGFLLLDQ